MVENEQKQKLVSAHPASQIVSQTKGEGFKLHNMVAHKKSLPQIITNIVILVNLEPILGFMVDIESIPNHPDIHTVSALCLNVGHPL